MRRKKERIDRSKVGKRNNIDEVREEKGMSDLKLRWKTESDREVGEKNGINSLSTERLSEMSFSL